MEKFLGQEYSEERRKEFLADNCDNVESLGYTRRFSTEELAQKKEELANASIKINDIQEEKAELMKDFRERLKPVNQHRKQLLEELKTRTEFVEENCYKFIDHENREVGFYNSLGELVYSRPIMPNEMQATVFSINRKTGTDE